MHEYVMKFDSSREVTLLSFQNDKKDFQLHHLYWNKKIFFEDIYRIKGTDDAGECCIMVFVLYRGCPTIQNHR